MTQEKFDRLYKKGINVRSELADASLSEFICIISTTIDNYCTEHNKDCKKVAKEICVLIQEKGENK